MAIKVKAEYKDFVFGFNNSGAPLGQRNDLHLLIADAKYTKQQNILDMFEDVDDADVITEKEKAFTAKQESKKATKQHDGAKE